MAALIILGLVAAITPLQNDIGNVFDSLSNELTSAGTTGGA